MTTSAFDEEVYRQMCVTLGIGEAERVKRSNHGVLCACMALTLFEDFEARECAVLVIGHAMARAAR